MRAQLPSALNLDKSLWRGTGNEAVLAIELLFTYSKLANRSFTFVVAATVLAALVVFHEYPSTHLCMIAAL